MYILIKQFLRIPQVTCLVAPIPVSAIGDVIIGLISTAILTHCLYLHAIIREGICVHNHMHMVYSLWACASQYLGY